MAEVFRDGITHIIDAGATIKTRITPDGHTIESWLSQGKTIFFANLADSVFCAHGNSEAEAIGDAIWKDPIKRPKMEALAAEIRPVVETRKITVQEFRLLTGACSSGCDTFLALHKLDRSTTMTLAEFLPIGGDWAQKLRSVLT